MFEVRLREIIDNSHKYTLRKLQRKVYPLMGEMKGEKYEKCKIEYECVKNEVLYGDDDEDSERVKQDFIKSLREIMTV